MKEAPTNVGSKDTDKQNSPDSSERRSFLEHILNKNSADETTNNNSQSPGNLKKRPKSAGTFAESEPKEWKKPRRESSSPPPHPSPEKQQQTTDPENNSTIASENSSLTEVSNTRTQSSPESGETRHKETQHIRRPTKSDLMAAESLVQFKSPLESLQSARSAENTNPTAPTGASQEAPSKSPSAGDTEPQGPLATPNKTKMFASPTASAENSLEPGTSATEPKDTKSTSKSKDDSSPPSPKPKSPIVPKRPVPLGKHYPRLRNYPFILSSEYYTEDENREMFSEVLMTNEDIVRENLSNLNGFDFLQPFQYEISESGLFLPDIPITRVPKETINDEWLMTSLRQAIKYHQAEKLIKTGQIHVIIENSSPTPGLLGRNYGHMCQLLVLLRMVVNCKETAHMLLSCGKQIYSILSEIIEATDYHMSKATLVQHFPTIESYYYMVRAAFVSHSQPVANSVESLNCKSETIHQNHMAWMDNLYGSKFRINKSTNEVVIPKFPEWLQPYWDNLTAHNLAYEIILCLSKHKVHQCFIKDLTPSKCIRQMENYVYDGKLDLNKLHIFYLLLQTPKHYLSRLNYPFGLYQQCYYHLSWAITKLIEMDPKNSVSELGFSLKFAVASANILTQMMKLPYDDFDAFREFKLFMLSENKLAKFVHFVLMIHKFSDFQINDSLMDLEASVWELIYEYPMDYTIILEVIEEAACSPKLHWYSCGKAALYIAVGAVFRGFKVQWSNLQTIRDKLVKLVLNTHQWQVKKKRYEIVLYLQILLNQKEYGLENASIGERMGNGMSDVFLRYTFLPENEDHQNLESAEEDKWYSDADLEAIPSDGDDDLDDTRISSALRAQNIKLRLGAPEFDSIQFASPDPEDDPIHMEPEIYGSGTSESGLTTTEDDDSD